METRIVRFESPNDQTKQLPISIAEEARQTLSNLLVIAQYGFWPMQTRNQLETNKKRFAWLISQTMHTPTNDLIFMPLSRTNLAYADDTRIEEFPNLKFDPPLSQSHILDTQISVAPIRLEMDLKKVLDGILNVNHRSETAEETLLILNLRSLLGNLSPIIRNYLFYLAANDRETARCTFGPMLSDVYPYCLPCGYYIDNPEKFLVFCAPDDQKNLPQEIPSLPA